MRVRFNASKSTLRKVLDCSLKIKLLTSGGCDALTLVRRSENHKSLRVWLTLKQFVNLALKNICQPPQAIDRHVLLLPFNLADECPIHSGKRRKLFLR